MAPAILTNPLRPVLLAAARSPQLQRRVSTSGLTRRLVKRFVPGAAEPALIAAAQDLLAAGRFISVDYLGEDTTDRAQAQATVEAYLSLLQAYAGLTTPDVDGVRPLEVSIKLSALGQTLPGDGHQVAYENARTICRAARDAGAWVNVDAEDHTLTDDTLAIVGELRQEFPDLATVLQAYLHRTEQDCRDLSGPGSRVRLCKGAYREPADVAFQKTADVDDSYLRCLKILMDGQGYPMVATHDPTMIIAAGMYAAQAGRGDDDYEHQMLFGVRDEEQQRLVTEGKRIRIYVPYGDEWYGYFMRRLAERPANLIFFLRSLVTRS